MSFIVFEGLDASGKSTQLLMLESYLKERDIKLKVTREPGGTGLAEELRNILIRTDAEAPVPRSELLIYEAARAQHVDKVIQPNLDQGNWVLCDRFAASSLAFQAGGRSIKEEDVVWLNNFATRELKPDLTIYIDITVEECEKRKSQRAFELGQEQDRFEREKKAFHQCVRDSYLKQSKDNSNWVCLDGLQDRKKLNEKIIEELQRRQWV